MAGPMFSQQNIVHTAFFLQGILVPGVHQVCHAHAPGHPCDVKETRPPSSTAPYPNSGAHCWHFQHCWNFEQRTRVGTTLILLLFLLILFYLVFKLKMEPNQFCCFYVYIITKQVIYSYNIIQNIYV